MLAFKHGETLAERLEGLLAEQSTIRRPMTSASPPVATRFVVRDGDQLMLIDVDRIDRFESLGNYVRVHSGGRTYLMRTTMDTVARRLASNADFVRVRRSAVINLRAVRAFERYGKSTYLIRLRDGANVISSRYYLPAIRAVLRDAR
jgi:DNA-binding LytR/AlgR family response regulator